MLEVKTRLVAPALMTLAAVAVAGCSASQDGPKSPPPPTTVATANFKIDLATSTLQVPYPYDLYFAIPGAPVDGTLNLPTVPWRGAAMRTALNSQDGWSTTASLDTSFTLPIDAGSISGSSIKIIRLWVNPQTKGPVGPDPLNPGDNSWLGYLPAGWDYATNGPIAGVLQYGADKDFVADVSPDYDSGGKILRITPVKPLAFSKGPMANAGTPNAGRVLNVGYLVLITNSLKSADGQAYGPDTLFASLKNEVLDELGAAAPAGCNNFSDSIQKALCQLTWADLRIAAGTGTDPASVVLAWNFSTQSIDDTLNYIALNSGPKQTLIVPTGKTTEDIGGLGHANIYVGSTVLPYYLTAPPAPVFPGTNPNNPNEPANLSTIKTAVNGLFWTAAGPPIIPTLDQTSRNLTMFNFAPLKTGDVTVPILVTVPNASSGCAATPVGGYPVAIVQHGITRNRTDALAIADNFADQCFIVVSMDLPLHGITYLPTDPDPVNAALSQFHCFAPPAAANPACLGAVERTFDVDFVNNTTGASAPDGKPDSSGAYFINLASPATGRDNLREAEADLIQLTKSLSVDLVIPPNPAVPAGATIDTNPARISYVGQSLGAIVGGSHIHFTSDTATATLSVPGGVLTKLIRESASLYTPVRNGLNASGLAPDSWAYNLYFRDFQAVLDSGDPINHIKDATAMHAVYLQKVDNDQVVPNSATDRLIAQGGFRKLTTLGFNPVGPGNPGYVYIKAPDAGHGVLFDFENFNATAEAQIETVLFSASGADPANTGVPLGLVDASVLDRN